MPSTMEAPPTRFEDLLEQPDKSGRPTDFRSVVSDAARREIDKKPVDLDAIKGLLCSGYSPQKIRAAIDFVKRRADGFKALDAAAELRKAGGDALEVGRLDKQARAGIWDTAPANWREEFRKSQLACTAATGDLVIVSPVEQLRADKSFEGRAGFRETLIRRRTRAEEVSRLALERHEKLRTAIEDRAAFFLPGDQPPLPV